LISNRSFGLRRYSWLNSILSPERRNRSSSRDLSFLLVRMLNRCPTKSENSDMIPPVHKTNFVRRTVPCHEGKQSTSEQYATIRVRILPPIAKAWPERMRTTQNVLQQSFMESCECWRDCCPTYCIVFADFRAPLSLLDSCSLLLRPESWCGRPLISLLGCP
jgi:hypothetical protein